MHFVHHWLTNLTSLVIQGLLYCFHALLLQSSCFVIWLFPISSHASVWEQSVRCYSGTQVSLYEAFLEDITKHVIISNIINFLETI